LAPFSAAQLAKKCALRGILPLAPPWLTTMRAWGAKQPDRAGHFAINMVWLRADYLFADWRIRPFVGARLGFFTWSGVVTDRDTAAKHSQKMIEFGGNVAVGADIRIVSSVSISSTHCNIRNAMRR
jgi:hypothetical protein